MNVHPYVKKIGVGKTDKVSIKNCPEVRGDCSEAQNKSLMGKKDTVKEKGAPTHRERNLSASFSKVGVCAFADNFASI